MRHCELPGKLLRRHTHPHTHVINTRNYIHRRLPPTRSRGMRLSSDPCFKNTLPAVCFGLMPCPSAVTRGGTAHSTWSGVYTDTLRAGVLRWTWVLVAGAPGLKAHAHDAPLVKMALVAGFCLNCSAANFNTAVNGAPSGTEKLHQRRKVGHRVKEIHTATTRCGRPNNQRHQRWQQQWQPSHSLRSPLSLTL